MILKKLKQKNPDESWDFFMSELRRKSLKIP